MQTHDPQQNHTQILPELPHEALYVGIDVGKKRHVAGFLSRTLLQRHQRYERLVPLIRTLFPLRIA